MAYDRGPQLFDPGQLTSGAGYTSVANLVAHAGGGRAAALPLTAAINHIGTCATAADSVALPPAVGGQQVVVMNSGAAAMQIFAAVGTSDTINGIIATTGISLASSGRQIFYSPAAGMWLTVLSA